MAEYLAVAGCFKNGTLTAQVQGYLEGYTDSGVFAGQICATEVHSGINEGNLAWYLGRTFRDDTVLVDVIRTMDLPRVYTVVRAQVVDSAHSRGVAQKLQTRYGGEYRFYGFE